MVAGADVVDVDDGDVDVETLVDVVEVVDVVSSAASSSEHAASVSAARVTTTRHRRTAASCQESAAPPTAFRATSESHEKLRLLAVTGAQSFPWRAGVRHVGIGAVAPGSGSWATRRRGSAKPKGGSLRVRG